jgi:hypothetical protein
MARTKAPPVQTHAKQLTTGGLGIHFASPIKPRDEKKSSTIVHVPGYQSKRQTLLHEIDMLKRRSSPSLTPEHATTSDMDITGDNTTSNDTANEGTIGCDQSITHKSQAPVRRRTQPGEDAYALYDRWTSLLPSLIDPLLSYDKTSMRACFNPLLVSVVIVQLLPAPGKRCRLLHSTSTVCSHFICADISKT